METTRRNDHATDLCCVAFSDNTEVPDHVRRRIRGGFTLAGGFWPNAGPACTSFAPADFDQDCDVDANDRDIFEACASSPGIQHNSSPTYMMTDLDFDNDVDHADFAVFQRCYSGENVPADPNCAN